MEKKLEELNPKETKSEETDEEAAYKNIKDKVVSRKVACYIATMSDTYAENMYRDLLGSTGDFIL